MKTLLYALCIVLLVQSNIHAQPGRLQAQSSTIYLPLVRTATDVLAFSWQSSPYDMRSDIAVVHLDGSGFHALTHTTNGYARKPAWSPDGAYIAFMLFQAERTAVYVMQADGSDMRELWSTSDPAYVSVANYADLVWSPDSTRIAFTGWHNSQAEITVLDRVSARSTRLTSGTHPQWSPDGAWIAFTTTLNGKSAVNVMRADGTQSTLLALGYKPRWSPDSSRIAYAVGPGYPSSPTSADLYLMNADGSEQHRILTTTGTFLTPLWTPGGTSIVAMAERTFIVTPEGTILQELSIKGQDPVMSPDGTYIATWAWVDIKAADIFITSLTDSGEASLPIGRIERDPAWRP